MIPIIQIKFYKTMRIVRTMPSFVKTEKHAAVG